MKHPEVIVIENKSGSDVKVWMRDLEDEDYYYLKYHKVKGLLEPITDKRPYLYGQVLEGTEDKKFFYSQDEFVAMHFDELLTAMRKPGEEV